ncbi:MAG: PQQ-binding-like beta-propeller repeat protein, partial [Planctomycetes bacterium]|nr:PQQ-binding-like beta-propeller repeat protein [Planctomycetota bacterium]
MSHFNSFRNRAFWLPAIILFLRCPVQGQQIDFAKTAGVHGGLVVQLGANETDVAAELSKTGRYLIHVLDSDPETVRLAQSRLREKGRYGLTWVEEIRDSKRLPYAENMVNLVVIHKSAPPLKEIFRVVAPGGTLAVTNLELVSESELKEVGFELISTTDSTLIARKPWPKAMDDWSHPRHAADGNAVSSDTLVGPPQRVRWIAAATSEVEGMVTAGGRNFYGGILARDSFNGLRLWHRDLRKDGGNNPTQFNLPRLSRDGPRPVASERLLFAVMQNRPVALDARTGEVVVKFGDMGTPTIVIHDGVRIIAADKGSVRTFNVKTGEQMWGVTFSDPRNIVADGKFVALIQGQVRRGEKVEAVVLDAATGSVKWRRDDYSWLERTTRTVLAKGQLVFEVSTMNDDDADNGIHVVAVKTGKHGWSKNYPPGMNHRRQARAMFLENDLWILHGGKINTSDTEKRTRQPVQISALDPLTGKTRVSYPAGLTHCFPPVATPNFMFAGEMDLTNLRSGETIANRITKANCSRENGWVPANGLVYTTPKHCTCWPMLRGFVAMAPAAGAESPAYLPLDQIEFELEKGPAYNEIQSPQSAIRNPQSKDWPLYRHDRWRSGSSVTPGPKLLGQRWSVSLHSRSGSRGKRSGAILHDWKDNPVVKGPVSAPTIANGVAYVTRPNAHELVAIDTRAGKVRWRFTANGRLDTPPAIHRGLCLFGSADGWVYALRADSGEVVWRLRAALSDERIVAYGQVESPWPVPGAVLVMDDVAYFAAGRQPLADGGILVFAVDPLTGERHWVKRIDTVPQKGFYENSGLEFDPFDILHAEGDGLAMSRWVLSLDGKEIAVDKWNAFAKLNTGAGAVWVPRGSWTYGARHQHRFRGEAPKRPLVVFRADNVYSSLNGTTNVFHRDFDLDEGEEFDSKWITGWKA